MWGPHCAHLPWLQMKAAQVTGFLAKKLGIHHQELNRYWTMKSSALLETKLKQSADLFHKDYVAGPTDRSNED